MQLFEDGYNRLNTNMQWYQYDPIDILNSGELEKEDNQDKEPERETTAIQTKKKNNQASKDDNTYTSHTIATDKPYNITGLHDPKNQLSSLIKNAMDNQESLKQRNKQRTKAKDRSRKQYGW